MSYKGTLKCVDEEGDHINIEALTFDEDIMNLDGVSVSTEYGRWEFSFKLRRSRGTLSTRDYVGNNLYAYQNGIESKPPIVFRLVIDKESASNIQVHGIWIENKKGCTCKFKGSLSSPFK